MNNDLSFENNRDRELAAVCGLYCGACGLYIGTHDDPARLKRIAENFHLPESEMQCNGCKSGLKGKNCRDCDFVECASKRGIEFCYECSDYPCSDLKQFQAERLHRIELFEDMDKIKTDGVDRWLVEVRKRYECPNCGTVNSAYDARCRKCGNEPSCKYVDEHRQEIQEFMKKMS